MTPEQKRMARHALGLPNGNRRSYRNYYAASLGSHAQSIWNAMVAAGLAECSATRGQPRTLIGFRLTTIGANAALDERETLDREDFPEAA